MLKGLATDLLKYSADVSVRLKAMQEESKSVEACSTAQLDAVMQAVVGMEAGAQEQTQQARAAMADGAATTAQQVLPYSAITETAKLAASGQS